MSKVLSGENFWNFENFFLLFFEAFVKCLSECLAFCIHDRTRKFVNASTGDFQKTCACLMCGRPAAVEVPEPRRSRTNLDYETTTRGTRRKTACRRTKFIRDRVSHHMIGFCEFGNHTHWIHSLDTLDRKEQQAVPEGARRAPK